MRCPYIIIFDSECSFCNSSVNFVFKHDPKGLFCFAPMHSNVAKSLIKEQRIDEFSSDTIILIKGDKSYLRAEAVYAILKDIDSLWRFLRIFRFLGSSCNDALYPFIAKNRHRIFSKKSCMIPSQELRLRLLTDGV